MLKIISLIGSSKYDNKFIDVENKLSEKGYLIFSPLSFKDENTKLTKEEIKNMINMEIKMKIKNSDSVFVVDVDGYIGKDTMDQLSYAIKLEKPVFYLSKGGLEEL